MAPDLSTPGLDTCLARLLHKHGRLDMQALLGLLTQVRREPGQGTLAEALARGGLVPEAELAKYLAEASQAAAETVSPAPAPLAEGWEPGQQVDGLLIQRKLGAGGMGAVYSARDSQTGALYAVKTLRAAPGSEDSLRFSREGEAQAAVDQHPNVVRVHRVGHGAGQAYLVMDLAPGGDLQARLARGPLPPREAARLVRDLALGLAHVHKHGVLHRDLKPANVVFGDRGEPMLMDFGLARFEGAETLTQSGTILGTPGYMAPEQVDPQRGAVTATADVYGLGAILYQCLTGRRPFSGSLYATLLAVLDSPPTSPRSLSPSVPAALEAICLHALAKSPGDRPQAARALADELDRFLAGTQSARRSSALGIGVACAVSVIAGSIAWGLHGDAPAPKPQPVIAREAARPTPSAAPVQTAAKTKRESAKDWIRQDRQRELGASIKAMMNDGFGVMKTHVRLAAACEELLDLNPPAELEQLAARGLVDAAYVICRLAPKKNWKDVLRFSRRARTILPNNSSAFQYCAIAEKKLGELKPALASVTRALELTPTRSERRARLHLLKADIYARLEKPTTRLAELKLAVSAPGGDTSPEIHGSLGDALLELQKLDSALVAYDRSIQLNPEQTHSYVRRSRTRRLLGDPQGALTDLTLAVGREDDLSLRVSYLQERASLYEQLNLVDKANADLERCAELNDRSAR